MRQNGEHETQERGQKNNPLAILPPCRNLISGASLSQLEKYQHSSAVPNMKYNCAILFLCQMYWSLCMLQNIFSHRPPRIRQKLLKFLQGDYGWRSQITIILILPPIDRRGLPCSHCGARIFNTPHIFGWMCNKNTMALFTTNIRCQFLATLGCPVVNKWMFTFFVTDDKL